MKVVTHYPKILADGSLQYMRSLCCKHSVSSAQDIELVTCPECLKMLTERDKARKLNLSSAVL